MYIYIYIHTRTHTCVRERERERKLTIEIVSFIVILHPPIHFDFILLKYVFRIEY